MNDAIVVAIIVASIALSGTFITVLIGLLKWKRNLKYQILRDEKDRLEKRFEICLDQYLDCLKKQAINAPLGAALLFEFPESVRDEFGTTLKSGAFSSSDLAIKQHAYFRMAFEMSKAIANYDKKIHKTYELVSPTKALKIASEIIQSGLMKW